MKYFMILLVLIAAPALADDYFFVEAGIYKSLGDNDWLGNYPVRFTAGHEWAGQRAYVRVEATHVSNIDLGPPFNGQYESYLDVAGVTVGWRFR